MRLCLHRSGITDGAVSTQLSLNDLPGYLSADGAWLWTHYYRPVITGINTQNQWVTSREQGSWNSKPGFRANRPVEAVLGMLALATFCWDSRSMLAGIQQRNILYEFPDLQDSVLDKLCTFIWHDDTRVFVHACGGGAESAGLTASPDEAAGKLVYLQKNLETPNLSILESIQAFISSLGLILVFCCRDSLTEMNCYWIQ